MMIHTLVFQLHPNGNLVHENTILCMQILLIGLLIPFRLFFSHTVKTVEHSPEKMRLKPINAELEEPGCRLPQNFSGHWANAANIDADLFINETHVVETYDLDRDRFRRTTYVCNEQKESLIVMARIAIDGW